MTIPPLPAGITLQDLDVSELTLRALETSSLAKTGRRDGRDWLTAITIDALLRRPRIGPATLVDFLVSLEHVIAHYVTPRASNTHSGIWSVDESRSHDPQSLDEPQTIQTAVAHTSNALPSAVPESTEAVRAEASALLKEIGPLDVAVKDPRLGEGIVRCHASGYRGNTLNELLATIVLGTSKNQPVDALEALQSLHREIVRMKGLPLEAELQELAARICSQRESGARNGEILARRLGWDGAGQRTLKTIGDEFGISRERARQICEYATTKLRKVYVFTPTLDRALALIAAEIPSDVTSIEDRLYADGITAGRFQLDGIAATAEALGRERFSLQEYPGLMIAARNDTDEPPIQIRIIAAAKKAVAHTGVTTITEVLDKLRASGKDGAREELIRNTLETQDWIAWLDSTRSWFWNPKPRHNPLLHHFDKILSVCHDIGVSELRDGVSRSYPKLGSAPPRHVLLEVCRQAGRYSVKGDRVSDGGKLDWRTELPGVEWAMVEVLQIHGPLLPTAEFEDRCRAAGVARNTFYAYIATSPVISKYARGVYGLRGIDVPAGLAESKAPATSRRKSLADYSTLEL